jgi:hypothetical protein
MKHFLFAAALFMSVPAFAQSAPTGAYEFLTLAESQSQQGSFAKIMFAPAFQGKTELVLESLPGTISGAKYMNTYRQNLEVVNQQLEAITAAGWELVNVSTSSLDHGHQYLFRRPKK